MKLLRATGLVAGTATALLALSMPAYAGTTHHHGGHHDTIWVDPGSGTIAAAVAAASPGDTIHLKKGTYFDSVAIDKTLTIKGSGWRTVIQPPAAFVPNVCNTPAGNGSPASEEGLCAIGAADTSGNPDLTRPVTDVHISDLRVTGFSDSGIIGFNTKGLKVHDVRSDHNGGYGIARFVSTDSLFEDNWTSWNTEAGLYMGDSPNAHSVLRDNKADNNGFGIFMRDSTDLTAVGNRVWGNCIGILALNTGGEAPGDLPAGDYRINDNVSLANDKFCPASGDGQPPLSGIGIGLAGVHDTVVAHNVVKDNQPGGTSAFVGGIVIVSTKAFGGTDPTNNTVRGNRLRNNTPVDIFWDGTGTGNTVLRNHCKTAQPSNLGWCH
jgi:parallel beta-helix repeat protein